MNSNGNNMAGREEARMGQPSHSRSQGPAFASCKQAVFASLILICTSGWLLHAQPQGAGRSERIIRLWLDDRGLQPAQVITRPGQNQIMVFDRLSGSPAEFVIVPEGNQNGRRLDAERLGSANGVDRKREYYSITLTPGRYIVTTPRRSTRQTLVIVQP